VTLILGRLTHRTNGKFEFDTPILFESDGRWFGLVLVRFVACLIVAHPRLTAQTKLFRIDVFLYRDVRVVRFTVVPRRMNAHAVPPPAKQFVRVKELREASVGFAGEKLDERREIFCADRFGGEDGVVEDVFLLGQSGIGSAGRVEGELAFGIERVPRGCRARFGQRGQRSAKEACEGVGETPPPVFRTGIFRDKEKKKENIRQKSFFPIWAFR